MPARTGLSSNRRQVGMSYRPAKRAKALSNPRRKAARREMEIARANPGPRPEGALGVRVSSRHSVGSGAGSQRGSGPGLSGNFQAGLGSQLSSRVDSGVISQEQASEVAKQRAALEAEFGPEWRTKVFGDRGYVQRTRKAMAKHPDSKRARYLYENLMKLRREALDSAGYGEA
jgi:hypothetical protein